MTTEQPKNQENQPGFVIQRIYVKDISFESPNSPQIFQAEWTPQVDINIATEQQKLVEDVYEVTLNITTTVKLKDKTAFLIEIKHAGIFTIKGFADEQLKPMLGSFCPSIIFPYTRELISETVTRGGFPPLYLAPINFDAYYQQQLEREKKN